MPRGEKMFTLLSKKSMKLIINETYRPVLFNKNYHNHNSKPENFSHIGWTTPETKKKMFRYRYVIQNSHTYLIDLCSSISWIPLKKTSSSCREYFNTVINSSSSYHLDEKWNQSMKDHFQSYVVMHERAVYGSDTFNHDDWYHFERIYNYIVDGINEMKILNVKNTNTNIINIKKVKNNNTSHIGNNNTGATRTRSRSIARQIVSNGSQGEGTLNKAKQRNKRRASTVLLDNNNSGSGSIQMHRKK